MKIIDMSYSSSKPGHRQFSDIKRIGDKWQVQMKDPSGLTYRLLLNDSEIIWVTETDMDFIKSFREKFNKSLDEAMTIYIKNFMRKEEQQ